MTTCPKSSDTQVSIEASKKCITCEDGKYQNLLTKTCEASLVMSCPTVIMAQLKFQKKKDIHESKEKIRAHRASSKATRLFLTK